ncbi:MAG TPA: type VII secretion protein EccCa [Candidatus Limnocylindrales bacterium]
MSPDLPQGDIALQPPPSLPREGGSQNFGQILLMLPVMLSTGAFSLMYLGRSNGALTWIFGSLFGLSTVGTLAFTLAKPGMQRKAALNGERRDYLRYLRNLRTQARDTAAKQQTAANTALPPPSNLWRLCGTERMWQRRANDPDFGRVRVATGTQLLASRLRAPETAPLEDLDPMSSAALRQFIRAHGSVPGLPVSIALKAFSRITIEGERGQVLDLANALLAQLVVFHAPALMRIACCAGPERQGAWEWLKWLPHSMDTERMDAAGPARLFAPSMAELAEVLASDLGMRAPFSPHIGPEPGQPHMVVLLDGGDAARLSDVEGYRGVTVIDVGGWPAEATNTTLELLIDGARLGMRTLQGVLPVGTPDHLPTASAEFLARQMTPLYTAATPMAESAAPVSLGLADLLGIGDPRTVDTAITWRPRPSRDRLRIPIGVDPAGRPVDLDIKESAEGGMGPHGLVIGATGSGKSELLRTLVTGLAVTHSSETLNMALVDFKGGATFAGLTDMPHVSAVITNLSDELTLVDRMGDALRGEMVRRQELLRSAGNFAAVKDYEKARLNGAQLDPLPSLLIVIDEFTELLTTRPEFTELFVMIGRLGRSLAMHMLLASQNLDEGRIRGLETHLSYRIALRTFSSAASRAVLGVPDAYELPPVPGAGYLRTDTSTLIRFKGAYVSGPLPQQRFDHTQPAPFKHRPVQFTLSPVPVVNDPEPAPVAEPSPDEGKQAIGQTVMDVMLGRLEGKGPPAYQIWLPPLGDPSTMDQMLPGLADTEDRGFTMPGWPGLGRLTVPVAIVDKPFEQRRDLLWADLSGSAGHAVVVGGPQSGKSTLLRTLVSALALTHTPAEAQFFLLDFGGGSLSGLGGLPHVSGVAGRRDAERCRRVISELTALLADREALFTDNNIDSMAAFRRSPVPQPDGRRFGDVFLVVDGWMTLRQDYEDLEEAVGQLAARGLGYGIHLLLSANRWLELRTAVRDIIGTQFELRLGEPSDSAIDRKAAANVPINSPGRGLTSDKLQFLTALPRVDGRSSVEDLQAGVADMVKRVETGWRGQRAPQLRLLPRELPVTQLPAPVPGDRRVPIGIAESDLGPVFVDFDTEPHFLTFGDTESGKSGLLRVLTAGICSRYSPKEAAIIVVDYRRSLLGAVPPEHLLEYCGTEQTATNAVAQAEAALRNRIPGPEVTPEQLRNRSWWKGPDLFVVVDDYDLVVTPSSNPVSPLAALMPQAKDIGLHVIVARRSGGASRALFEPVMQRMRDLAAPGLLLSGPKDEGPLLGNVKPGPQPPGRGQLVSRRTGTALIQVAWSQPT